MSKRHPRIPRPGHSLPVTGPREFVHPSELEWELVDVRTGVVMARAATSLGLATMSMAGEAGFEVRRRKR